MIEFHNLAEAVRYAAEEEHRTLTVRYSFGGRVGGLMKALDLAKELGVKFRIEGDCYSACGFLLSTKDVCVDGSVGAHSTHDGRGNMLPQVTEYVRKFHPPALRVEFDRLGAYDKMEMTLISPDRLRELGIPGCDNKS